MTVGPLQDEALTTGLDVAEGKRERAWRGAPDKNPMLRPLIAALDFLALTEIEGNVKSL